MQTIIKDFETLPDSALLRLEFVRILLGNISRSTVYRMVQNGKLTPHQISARAVGYRVGDIRKILGEA